MPIGTFGPVAFEVSSSLVRTYDEMKRDGAAKWAEHDILGRKPKLEFGGSALEENSFRMVLSTDLGTDPDGELDALREFRDKGEVGTLVLGETVVGRFVLESLSQSEGPRNRRGGPTWIEVDLKLKEYAS